MGQELKLLLCRSYYSLDECILLCRINSMLQHCGCASSPMAGTALNVSYCTLLDLPCLMKWRGIWNGFNEYPYVEQYEEGAEDASSMSQCPLCLPNCDGVNFEITSNVAPLRKAFNATGYAHGLLYVTVVLSSLQKLITFIFIAARAWTTIVLYP